MRSVGCGTDLTQKCHPDSFPMCDNADAHKAPNTGV